MRVVMATEGTYPFSGGGVSTWCHQLCEGLSGVEYTLLAVTGDTRGQRQYDLPASVDRVLRVPLWPDEEPAPHIYGGRFSDVLRRRFATTDDAVRVGFVPHLSVLAQEIFFGDVQPDELLSAFAGLGRYLRAHDYKASMQARSTWSVFTRAASAWAGAEREHHAEPSVGEVTTCARWFYNMMMPLAVRVGEPAVFHSTSAASCALPGVVARLVDGIPFVLTEHGVYLRERYLAVLGSDYTPLQKRFLVGLAGMVARACYRAADVIAPVAAFNTEWEVRWGAPPDRIRVIYNGVDTAAFAPPSGAPPPARERPTVVAAARLFPLKDIETMIRAADAARRSMPQVQVLVFGSVKSDPPYVERCRALIRELGLEEHFFLKGFHPRPAEIFHEGDVSVLSSISEGFPYTVIESMSCGVPCVATDVGGVREAIADTGVVVRPRDPEALGRALVELLRNPARRRELGRRARERVLQEFSLNAQLVNYEDLYREVTRGR